jgi:hypothetical protein
VLAQGRYRDGRRAASIDRSSLLPARGRRGRPKIARALFSLCVTLIVSPKRRRHAAARGTGAASVASRRCAGSNGGLTLEVRARRRWSASADGLADAFDRLGDRCASSSAIGACAGDAASRFARERI